MPYTKENDRVGQYDPIEELAREIKVKGDLNHAICELTALVILRHGGMGYANVSEWVDAVGGAHDEMRRRLLDPYEDEKIMENGDVRSFVKLLQQLHPDYQGYRKDS
jgi:hypothetical protein